jgi:hydroxymethylglutaryl-CoA lyase
VESWAFHGHDTYGMGVANVLAAWRVGLRTFDASFGGIGGCPFAPGATGNVATEDLVWMFDKLGVQTGVDLDALLKVARDAAALPGAIPGGRVRDALEAARRREVAL